MFNFYDKFVLCFDAIFYSLLFFTVMFYLLFVFYFLIVVKFQPALFLMLLCANLSLKYLNVLTLRFLINGMGCF